MERDKYFRRAMGGKPGARLFFLCHSKNKPPALQVEGRSLDISMNSCVRINVGLQTTNKIAQEVLRWTLIV